MQKICEYRKSLISITRFVAANPIRTELWLSITDIDSGRKDKALENAWESADFVDCADWKLAKIYEGEELKKQLRRNIRELTRLLYLSINQMRDTGGNFDFTREDEALNVQFQWIKDSFDS